MVLHRFGSWKENVRTPLGYPPARTSALDPAVGSVRELLLGVFGLSSPF